MNDAFKIFSELLLKIHIPTKTTDTQFHKDSEKAYELAFDVAHLVLEINQDLEIDKSKEVDDVGLRAYELCEELKKIIGDEISENDDPGKDNLLRTLYQRAVDICGTMRQYATEEYDEDESTED